MAQHLMTPAPIRQTGQTTRRPKVSVCVITYNQRRYIDLCLRSIVEQRTNFEFEVIVGEDCSTDGTRDIVQQYAATFPALIKPILHAPNVGGCANYLAVHRAARGDYVAHIDGDDAMLPGKLQSQADLLDQQPDTAGCFHLVEIIDTEGVRTGRPWLRGHYSGPQDFGDILRDHPHIGHSSLMYRRAFLEGFLASRTKDFIDLHIYLFLAARGPLAAINEKLGLYRQGVGTSANRNVLDLAFDAIHTVAPDCAGDAVRQAGLRFASDFAKSALLARQQDLFLRYFERRGNYLQGGAGMTQFGMLALMRREWLFRMAAAMARSTLRAKSWLKSKDTSP